MFSSRKDNDNPPVYPAVPNSLRSESVEMTEMRKVQEARADTAPEITPYLSLRSRLSQIWMNRWTILLILVLVRVMILIVDLKENVGSAKVKALSACTKVEDVGSAMASMPHYLSRGVNELAASGIEKSVEAMVYLLDLVLVGVKNIIIFYINFLTATYVCLITAMVHGSLNVVADVTEGATEKFNSLIDKAVDKIESISQELEDGINKVTKGIEDSVLGGLVPDIPKVDFSSPIEELKDFDLKSEDFVKDVRKLEDDLPDFREVQNLTEQAISIPFDFVRKALNETYGNYRFDRNAFPLAQKKELSFCSENATLNDFFQNLFDLIAKARTIFIAVLIILALAAIIPMAWLEIRRWRRQQQHARLIAQNAYDPMDIVYIASRPMTATLGIKVASHFKGKRQILVRWLIAYATSVPALFILSLAIAGFFSCFCQWLLLRAIKDEVPALANQVGAFADDVVQNLEGVSAEWANDANGVITGFSDDINHDVLGYVTNATDAVNDTLNTFLETMDDGLNTVFKGTILLDPIKSVLHCVIGIKIESVQKGLTWVHDHSTVHFPLFENNTFSMGAKDSVEGDSELNSFLASPSSGTTDEVTGAVKAVTDWLHSKLIQDALISTALLLLYVLVVLGGIVWTLVGMVSPDKGRAEGGMRYTGDNRPGFSPRVGHHDPANPDGSTHFPRFGSSSSEEDHYREGLNGRDEKFMSGATGARATQIDGHQRTSSYGYLDTASGKY
ncbi:plasma membrane fusion PRM1 [Fusarium heterosporum]|uniref:Plasma membrane fusion protein PRM1 n=1 Tax=Fusarium heterosporum TaxID=42747 RepID=A0A8H5TR93_FUSHE|nr:plasma membrane fusion PRM1 [Fusarium heterosporum]